jgi:hypothetical protein
MDLQANPGWPSRLGRGAAELLLVASVLLELVDVET